VKVDVRQMPRNAEEATRRSSIHVRAPRGKLQNQEGQKVLMHKYARRVDNALRGVLAGRETPLILAADEPLATMFRSLNSYTHLVQEGIPGNPGNVTDRQLEDATLPILDRLYWRELATVIARYDELKPWLTTADLSHAAHAATAAAIRELVVDLDAVVPGLVSDMDGSVAYSTSDNAKTYNVVDEVAKRALCTGARVLAAKREELPGGAQLIAVLRYQFG
jgi:hypothetical protein